MIWFVAKTLVAAVLRLLVALAVVFLVLNPLAGGLLDPTATARSFWTWISGAALGDFGLSVGQAAPVGVLLVGRLAVSGPLVGLALLIAIAVGAGIGYAAGRSRGWLDRPITGLMRIAAALPVVWFGLLLILVFSLALHLLPTGGFVGWATSPTRALLSLLLPAVALGLPTGAALAVIVRDGIAAVVDADYVREAEARGLTRAEAIRRHGVRNIIRRVLETAWPVIASLVLGVIVVETVFYLPGVGRLLLDAQASGDTNMLKGALVVLFAGVAVAGLALRFGLAWADPRLWRRTVA